MRLTLTYHDERIEAPVFSDRVARSTQALQASGQLGHFGPAAVPLEQLADLSGTLGIFAAALVPAGLFIFFQRDHLVLPTEFGTWAAFA